MRYRREEEVKRGRGREKVQVESYTFYNPISEETPSLLAHAAGHRSTLCGWVQDESRLYKILRSRRRPC